MDYKATLMALVLVSSALAGCTGDPDGGGGDEVDTDALQDLFDEHFQDFINNTTITVINNYHNNKRGTTTKGGTARGQREPGQREPTPNIYIYI